MIDALTEDRPQPHLSRTTVRRSNPDPRSSPYYSAGRRAVALLGQRPDLSVGAVAARLGVPQEVVYRCWYAEHPDRPPRGPAWPATWRLRQIRDLIYRHLADGGADFRELYDAARGRFPQIRERTMYRQLRVLIDAGQVTRRGPRGHGVYQRRHAT